MILNEDQYKYSSITYGLCVIRDTLAIY
jgi:hypothetical protein